MRAHHRLAVAAFCTDMALYLLMLSLPFRALAHGATPLVLGLIPVLYAGPYSLVVLFAGRLSDRWPRRGPIRAGCTVAALAALNLARVERLEWILGSVPFIGVGLGFFWPSLQAGFSELRGGRDIGHLSRILNLSWSLGKGSGFLLGGVLLSTTGATGLSLSAALALLIAAAVLPYMPRPGDHSEVIASEESIPPLPLRVAFMRSAWIANGITFGAVATLNYHFPKLIVSYGMGPSAFGLFLGLVFLSQTLFFALGGQSRWWHHRLVPLIAVQLFIAVAVVTISHVRVILGLVAIAPLLGIGLGFAYQSSLYYSLHAAVGRGRQAGFHEGALGLASASIPLLGGVAASRAGLFAPYFVSSIAALLSAGVGATWLLRARRATAARAGDR